MKTFINRWLVPPFLKRWDTYLLVHHPVLWHSRTIWVLFYGLLAAPFLFAAGFFHPIDAQHLTVDPIRPIEMARDAYYLYTVLFLSLGFLYWAFRQSPLGFPFSQAKEVLLTICLYALCFWALLGITAPAFRMGTIYKTAYHWMSDEDLNNLEESGIYPYGFVLLSCDTSAPPSDTFFQRREEMLKTLVQVEDTLLKNNYQVDLGFWFNDRLSCLSYQLDLSNLSDLSYLPSISYWSYLACRKNHSYLSYVSSYASYVSHQSDLSYLFYLSYQSYLSYQPHLSYSSYRSYLSFRLHLSYPSNLSDLSDWYAPYGQYKNAPPLSTNLGNYQFVNTIDSILLHSAKGDNIWFQRPTLPYSVEDAVRSVKHARLYLEEGIYFRHLFHILHYVFLAALVLLGVPLLRLKNLVIIVVALGVAFINITALWSAIYLMLPAIALGGLGVSIIKKKYYPSALFFFTLAILNLFIPLFVIWISDYLEPIDYVYYPSNLAFYGLQALALVAALLMPYVRALPKVD